MASPTNYFACSQSRTLPPGWLRALDGLLISRLYSATLPVRQRVVFKVATLVYQSLSGHAPGYLVDDCQRVTDVSVRQQLLHSADT